MDERKVSYRAGAIVVNPLGQIALANEHLWGFPRGGVDEGEDYVTASKREVREEIGGSVIDKMTSFEELGTYERYPNGITKDTPGAYPMEIHMYLLVTSEEGELNPEDKDVKEAKWFSYEDALAQLTNEEDRMFLESHKESIFTELDKELAQRS